MSAVHGVMDLEVGCTWKNYGDIYYLTEEQQASPSVVQAIHKRWIISVSDAEVRYASMDSRKNVGPRPPVPQSNNVVKPMAVSKADANMDAIKKDIAKLNSDIQSLAGSIHSIVDLLAKGIPVQQAPVSDYNHAKPVIAAIPDSVAEELFIPTFKVKDDVSLKADSAVVADEIADKALEELKKLRKKKSNTDG